MRSKDTEVNNITSNNGVSKINYNQVIIDPSIKHRFNLRSKSPIRGKKRKIVNTKHVPQYEVRESKEEINCRFTLIFLKTFLIYSVFDTIIHSIDLNRNKHQKSRNKVTKNVSLVDLKSLPTGQRFAPSKLANSSSSGNQKRI